MKKLTILTAILIASFSFAQIPNYVPTNGIVGWWPFNGNANDESGNGNNGTVNGATLTSDRNGVASSAYSFDGINDYIIGLSNSFPTNQRTVSVWFFSNNIGIGNLGRGVLGYGGNTCGQSWCMILDNAGSPSGQNAYEVNTHCNVFSVTKSYGSNVPNGNWHNWIVTTDPSGTKFYLDGNLIQSSNQFINNTIVANKNFVFGIFTNPNGIGASINDPNNTAWNGMMDDIGIWSRALSDCEIKDLYYTQLGFTTIDAGQNQTICKGDTTILNGTGGVFLSWNNGVLDSVPFAPQQTNSYVLTGGDNFGCVGSDTVEIVVLDPSSSSQTQTALDTYTWPVNNQTYTQSGTYTDTLVNAVGCDSIVTLNLTLSFTGINDLNASTLSISPNPTAGDFTIAGFELNKISTMRVSDVNGKLVKELDPTATKFTLGTVKPGVYFLTITAGNKQEVIKIIKE